MLPADKAVMRYARLRQGPRRPRNRGLTLIEIMVTVVCLAVAAVIVLPTVSDNSGERLRGAAQILVADLEVAQSESMSNTDNPCLFVSDADNLGYQITTKKAPTVPIINRAGGEAFVTRFGQGRAGMAANVTVGPYSLGGDDRLSFGALGQLDQATAATIELRCNARKVVITIDPTTGDVSMGNLN